MLKTIVIDIAKKLKVEAPTPNDTGAYRFLFDKALTVDLLPTKKDSIVIVAPISDSLEDNPKTQKLLKQLLEINFSRLKDNEEILTWDPDSAQIILSKEIPHTKLSEQPMLGQLEKFLNNLEFWKTTIIKISTDTSPLSL